MNSQSFSVMRTQQINQINEALLIMRHFIDLSARLLPFLEELTSKRKPTKNELNDIERISEVYRNHSFDPKTSETLLDSNILELIQRTFNKISSPRRKQNELPNELGTFWDEYNRLTNHWNYVSSN